MIYALEISQDNFAPAKFTNLASFLNILLPLTMVGAALIFLVMALFGGFTWLTSGGSQENLAKAQKTFINAIIGLVIVIFAFVLTKVIGYMLNVDILK
jgi:ABC-type spermidine/putrescine transport system permease subunit II